MASIARNPFATFSDSLLRDPPFAEDKNPFTQPLSPSPFLDSVEDYGKLWDDFQEEERLSPLPWPTIPEFTTKDIELAISDVSDKASNMATCLSHLETTSIGESFLQQHTQLKPWKFKELESHEKIIIKEYLELNCVVLKRDLQKFCIEKFQKVVVSILPRPYPNTFVLYIDDLNERSLKQLRACIKGKKSFAQLSKKLKEIYLRIFPEQTITFPSTSDYGEKQYEKLLERLETGPLTYEYLRDHSLSPPKHLGDLSSKEISKVNKTFQKKLITTDRDVQKFCINKFRKVIMSQKLTNAQYSTRQSLKFYVLRTGQRMANEQDLLALKEAKEKESTEELPAHLHKFWKQIRIQEASRKKNQLYVRCQLSLPS